MELKEALNEVFIEGVLKEKSLELTTITDAQGKKSEVIRGELVISDKENSEHRVRVFANKVTKEGKENSVYKGLVTVMGEYVSVAEALKAGQTADAAEKVRITKGKLGLNEYYTPNGELRSFPVVNTNFVNRVKDGTYNPKAEFSLEIYFESIAPEMKEGEETGRLIIKAIVPVYGGEVIPLTLIVADEDAVNYIQTNYEKGRTGKVWGELVNTVEVTKTIEKGFGKAKEKIVTKILNELVVTGGEEEQYDPEDVKLSYSAEIIKKAMAERDVKLDALLKKSKDNGKKTSKSTNAPAKKELNF